MLRVILRGGACALALVLCVPSQAQEAAYTLQILHASDLEGNADAVANAPNFAAIVDKLAPEYDNTLLISSGDNFIPSPFSNAAGADDPEIQAKFSRVLREIYDSLGLGEDLSTIESASGRLDITIMNILGFDASALGNHEFDFGQAQLARIIGPDEAWVGTQFPYLSANLGIPAASALKPVDFGETLLADNHQAGVIAPAAIVERGGEFIGIIGATTPLLETISSTHGDPDDPSDDVTIVGIGGAPADEMAELAAVLQPVVDEMVDFGAEKIILASHLQQLDLERELAGLLYNVDIILAGGSDTRLADANDILREGDEAQGPYPIVTRDAEGNPVLIASTDGQYTYVGRLVVGFDEAGRVIPESVDPAVSGAYATDEAGVLRVTGAATLDEAIAGSEKASLVKKLVDEVQENVLAVSGSNVFGAIAVDLNGERQPGVRTRETNLGNLTADANLFVANRLAEEPVHVSLKNGGGIRASVPVGDGKLSELEIEQVLAFNNGLSLVTLSPEDLLAVLNHGVAASEYDAEGNPTNAEGRFPQVGGLAFSFDPSRPAGERVREVVITGTGESKPVTIVADGAVTETAASAFPDGIRLVTLDFLLSGGDGYPYPATIEAAGEAANVVSLVQPDVIADGTARFTNVGTEQDALAEYMAANFPADDPGSAFAMADAPPSGATRIVNLGVPGVTGLAGR